LYFDTINPALVWEAEDYDFTNGLYLNSRFFLPHRNPTVITGLQVFRTLIFQELDRTGPICTGRTATAGVGPASEAVRQKFLTAQLTDTGVQDYAVGYIGTGDWMNLQPELPRRTYSIYARLAAGAGPTVVALSDTNGTVFGEF